jgi:hypothetical protein
LHFTKKIKSTNLSLLFLIFFHFQFVAHSNVQQLLASIWYEGLPGFRRKNMALQALEIIRIGNYRKKKGTFLILFTLKLTWDFCRHIVSAVFNRLHDCTTFNIWTNYAKTVHKIYMPQCFVLYIFV